MGNGPLERDEVGSYGELSIHEQTTRILIPMLAINLIHY